jgi:putative DNA primase/helicase
MSDEPADDFDRIAAEYVAARDRGDVGEDTDLTEDGVAKAFAEHYAGTFVYDHELGSWLEWDGTRWTRDLKLSVFHHAREFTREINSRLTKPFAALAKISFASAVERASRADPKMAVVQSIWDRDPMLLGTPDGVVDLRTGILQPNAPDLYISKCTSVSPAPDGTPCPMWQDFLDSATQYDKELQGFLQRLCGYVLTGDVTEEILAFLYGSGGNGKGVLLSTLTGIMAEYAVAVPIEVFTANSYINMEYYRAQMAGARLVTASETESRQHGPKPRSRK